MQRQFVLHPEQAVISILDEEAPTFAFPYAFGSFTSYNESEYPYALIVGNLSNRVYPIPVPKSDEWMRQSTFVFAERTLSSFQAQYDKWLNFETIQPIEFTYPNGKDKSATENNLAAILLLLRPPGSALGPRVPRAAAHDCAPAASQIYFGSSRNCPT